MANIIDGKEIAEKIKGEVKKEVEELKRVGIVPKLSVILAGEDPASLVYVKGKEKACAEVGIASDIHRLSEDVSEDEVIKLISRLNNDVGVHGILVQLPLPQKFSVEKILSEISPSKDVDGLHPINLGKLLRGEEPSFVPCTPMGIIELIKSTGIEIKGKEAVVVGRSNIVGKPVSILLLAEHATVTICHSRTKDLGVHTKNADIAVFAVGKPKIVHGSMIKPGAIVIDVGVNRTEQGLVGDVDFESAKEVAGWITPVPGGVGPMTIAMLLKNTIKAAKINS